jgi:hypothetical protein
MVGETWLLLAVLLMLLVVLVALVSCATSVWMVCPNRGVNASSCQANGVVGGWVGVVGLEVSSAVRAT